jgi:hypothetical protein
VKLTSGEEGHANAFVVRDSLECSDQIRPFEIF